MEDVPFTLTARPLFFLYGDSITQLGSKVSLLPSHCPIFANMTVCHLHNPGDWLALRAKTDPLGWVARLQESYSASYRVADVLNRGYSGYNTRCVYSCGHTCPQLVARMLMS